MNNDRGRSELDEILFEFVREVERPDWAAVEKWMSRYPQHKKEISEFAAARIISEVLPENPETAALPEKSWLAIGKRAYERAVAEGTTEYVTAPLTSLADAARAQGKDIEQLALETRVSETLLLKLDRRLVKAASVPVMFVSELARALHTSVDSLGAYLAQPPRLATGAQYRSERTPAVQQQESFAEAVQNDRSITGDNRERLIAMLREDGGDPA